MSLNDQSTLRKQFIQVQKIMSAGIRNDVVINPLSTDIRFFAVVKECLSTTLFF
jgi:hypothetical protein